MYVGRIVGAGRTFSGQLAVGYRISSRSFPNREMRKTAEGVEVVAREGTADAVSDSPYIKYESILANETCVVASNGSHTLPIFRKLSAGQPARDALANVLLGMDREFDSLDTPRIAAVVDRRTGSVYLASVTKSDLSVVRVDPQPGQFYLVATYGYDLPMRAPVDVLDGISSAEGLCRFLMSGAGFRDFDLPVSSAAAIVPQAAGGPIDIAILNPLAADLA